MSMANTTKVQPGLEAETAVIGALIYAPEIVKDVLFAVREQDFGIEINRKIFRAARDLYLRAKPVTAVTIRDTRLFRPTLGSRCRISSSASATAGC